MQFLIMYIASILISVTGEAIINLKLIKDAANEGYLIEYKKWREALEKLLNSNSLMKYIPIINIAYMISNAIQYNHTRKYIAIDNLNELGLLKKMSDEETKEYNKKPSAFRALKIDIDRELKLNKPTTSVIEVYNNTGKIWYEKSERDFNILKSSGSAKDLSRFTQIKLIEENLDKLYNEETNNNDYQVFDKKPIIISQKENYEQESHEKVKTLSRNIRKK